MAAYPLTGVKINMILALVVLAITFRTDQNVCRFGQETVLYQFVCKLITSQAQYGILCIRHTFRLDDDPCFLSAREQEYGAYQSPAATMSFGFRALRRF